MKGILLAFSVQQSNGVISGNDGKRYKFLASSWKSDKNPEQGLRIDFDVSHDGEALDIYLDLDYVNGSFDTAGKPGYKSRSTTAILAFFLGYLGVHKFYLGNNQAGIIMLLISVLGAIIIVPTIVVSIIAFIEFITYLTKSDKEFYEIYIKGKKSWF